jgi:hypothetical protein
MGFNPLAAVVGALVPVKTSSKQYLKQEMKKYGIDPYKLPPSLFTDLNDQAYKLNELFSSSRMDLMDRMIRAAAYDAHLVACYLAGKDMSDADPDTLRIIQRNLG